MEPQICKIYLAFTNSVVISIFSTAIFCVFVGSMAAYALARIQYAPKFGNIMIFVLLIVGVICRHHLCRRALVGPRRWRWRSSSSSCTAIDWRPLQDAPGNGDILFWIISQRILPPIVVVIPLYVMFQAVRSCWTPISL